MSDTDTESNDRTSVTNIPRFHGKGGEDYGLWRLRLRAACRVKGVWKYVDKSLSATPSRDTSESTGTDQIKLSTKLEKASAMIISALGDSPMRVIADVDDDPARMLELLDARYASSRTASRIAVQTQLFCMRYAGQDMSTYIDEYTALFNQLEFMGKAVAVPEAHKAAMLLASIDPTSDLEAIAVALRTMDVAELTWEYVTTTLIDEYNARNMAVSRSNKGRKKRNKRKGKTVPTHLVGLDEVEGSSEESFLIQAAVRALVTAMQNGRGGVRDGGNRLTCEFCGKHGHRMPDCFMNPDNPGNKLTPKMKERMMVTAEKSGKTTAKDVFDKNKQNGPGNLVGVILCHNVEKTTV